MISGIIYKTTIHPILIIHKKAIRIIIRSTLDEYSTYIDLVYLIVLLVKCVLAIKTVLGVVTRSITNDLW